MIVGGGGHGLATAYYLARRHGITDVLVLEKGWLGGGNTGRNTTIVRSNYHLPENARFYEHSLKLWENLSDELNFNVMYSARGVLNLAHSPQDVENHLRRGNAMRLQGIDAELLDRKDVMAREPLLDCSADARFPVLGGLLQPRGGTVRHDAVAWGYARAADALGVDIVQQCEVTGFRTRAGRIEGVETTRGLVRTRKLALAVAFGATETVLATDDDVAKRVIELTGGGVDVVLENVGRATLDESMQASAPGATIVMIGTGPLPKELPKMPGFYTRNLMLKAISNGSRQMFADLLAGMAAAGIQPVIEKRFAFEDAIAAFREMETSDHVGKVLIQHP